MSENEAMQKALCARMEAEMLTAELSELRGAGDSDLAVHLRSCVHCRAGAQRFLLGNTLLSERIELSLARKRNSSSAWPLWLALPIAAMLAGLVVLHERTVQLESIPRVGSLQSVKRPVEVPVVNVPADRNVAVFEANKITVVWDLGRKEGS